MKTSPLFPRALTCACILATSALFAAEESPIVSDRISAANDPAALAEAVKRGAASATKDISAGTFRILYYGLPWSQGKPLVDDATGYRVQIVAGCVITTAFVSEVDAYNSAMRDWHAKQKPAPQAK